MTNLQTTRILIRFIYSMAVLLRKGHCTSDSDFKRELDAAENELNMAEHGNRACPDCGNHDTARGLAGFNIWCWSCNKYVELKRENRIDATVQR